MNLRLLQLGDSALPIGGYSHSWGLEAAVDQGLVRDAASLEHWTASWLAYMLAPGEGVIVAATTRAALNEDWSQFVRANHLLTASLTPPTLRHASREMGEQLLGLAEVWPWASSAAARLRQEGEGRHHAPVFAVLAAAASASPQEAVAVYLHQAALGVISAGVRGIPIGHTHGQQILARLHGRLQALAADLAERELDSAGGFAPAYEVLCHAQTQLYTRLFRS